MTHWTSRSSAECAQAPAIRAFSSTSPVTFVGGEIAVACAFRCPPAPSARQIRRRQSTRAGTAPHRLPVGTRPNRLLPAWTVGQPHGLCGHGSAKAEHCAEPGVATVAAAGFGRASCGFCAKCRRGRSGAGAMGFATMRAMARVGMGRADAWRFLEGCPGTAAACACRPPARPASQRPHRQPIGSAPS